MNISSTYGSHTKKHTCMYTDTHTITHKIAHTHTHHTHTHNTHTQTNYNFNLCTHGSSADPEPLEESRKKRRASEGSSAPGTPAPSTPAVSQSISEDRYASDWFCMFVHKSVCTTAECWILSAFFFFFVRVHTCHTLIMKMKTTYWWRFCVLMHTC